MNMTAEQNKMLDAIHFLTDPKFRDILDKGEALVDWTKVASEVLSAFPGATPGLTNSDIVSVYANTIREDIDSLKGDVSFPKSPFGKLVDIVDRLERRGPNFVSVPILPTIFPPFPAPLNPWTPWSPNGTPYVGDPPGGIPGTTMTVPDATGSLPDGIF